MKFSHYLEKLEASKEFKDFTKKNPQAKLCAGFFIIDLEQGKNSHQIDYLLPNGKIATFNLDNGVQLKMSEIPGKIKKKLANIENKSKLDMDVLKGIVEDEMKNQTITENIKKIIAVLQVLDKKLVWNLNCICGGMNIIQVHIDDKDGSVLKFERHSLMEMIRQG